MSWHKMLCYISAPRTRCRNTQLRIAEVSAGKVKTLNPSHHLDSEILQFCCDRIRSCKTTAIFACVSATDNHPCKSLPPHLKDGSCRGTFLAWSRSAVGNWTISCKTFWANSCARTKGSSSSLRGMSTSFGLWRYACYVQEILRAIISYCHIIIYQKHNNQSTRASKRVPQARVVAVFRTCRLPAIFKIHNSEDSRNRFSICRLDHRSYGPILLSFCYVHWHCLAPKAIAPSPCSYWDVWWVASLAELCKQSW